MTDAIARRQTLALIRQRAGWPETEIALILGSGLGQLVPEAIMARALALVTNLAGGSAGERLSHRDVLVCSAAAAEPFGYLVKTLLSEFIPG